VNYIHKAISILDHNATKVPRNADKDDDIFSRAETKPLIVLAMPVPGNRHNESFVPNPPVSGLDGPVRQNPCFHSLTYRNLVPLPELRKSVPKSTEPTALHSSDADIE
jgi:hypothetical protein